jgi:hypothetical protein
MLIEVILEFVDVLAWPAAFCFSVWMVTSALSGRGSDKKESSKNDPSGGADQDGGAPAQGVLANPAGTTADVDGPPTPVSKRLADYSQFAGIASGAAAVITLIAGLWIFYQTNEAQREAQVLGVLQEYLKLAAENPEIANESFGSPNFNDWFASHALFTGETIYNMTDGKDGWAPTVQAIIREQQEYLISGSFDCKDYDRRFVAYIRAQIRKSTEGERELKCQRRNESAAGN